MGRRLVITQALVALVPWVSPEGWSRLALEHVVLTPDGRQVASNGRGLAILEPAEGARGAEHPEITEDRYLHRRFVEKILACLPDWLPKQQPAAIEDEALHAGGVQVAIPQLEGTLTMHVPTWRPGPGKKPYPAYAKVLPSGKPVVTFRVQTDDLARLAQSAETLGSSELTLQFYGPDCAMQAVCEGEQGQLTVVLMPLRPIEASEGR